MPNPSRPPFPARALLFAEPAPGALSDRERRFGPQRLPGTAPVAARRTRPDLFQDTLEAPPNFRPTRPRRPPSAEERDEP